LIALGGDEEAADLLQFAAWRLLAVDPGLLYRVLKAWFSVQPAPQAAGEQIQLLRLQMAEAGDESQFDIQCRRWLEEGAGEWGVKTSFIDRNIVQRAVSGASGEMLSRHDEMNIALAIGSESLRRLLTVSLLKSIA
jgi:hypothetical protein